MTLNQIVKLLKETGKNTKLQVINMLENANQDELIELRQSINEKICKNEEVKYKCYGQARPLRPGEKQYE
ncbi:MAG: hypothetical protein EOL97_14320 [Spirochaetia bacterium]|nr:hypothetical protein [Spirochaetia bacterium]